MSDWMIRLFLLRLIPLAFTAFLWTTLKRVPPAYRRLEPVLVWLLVVPLFDLFWAFFVLPRISQSLTAYFQKHGRFDVGRCRETLGTVACAIHVLTLVNAITWTASIVWFCLMIAYLIRTSSLAEQIPPAAAFGDQ